MTQLGFFFFAQVVKWLPAHDKISHLCKEWLCSVSQHWTFICSHTPEWPGASLQTPGINKCCLRGSLLCTGLFFSSSLSGQSLCITIWQKNETLYLCVWLLEVVWYVCVGQMARGSNPKWNRPSFVGDIMTYLKWFLEGLVALAPLPWFVQQSGTFQKHFFPLFAGGGFVGGCVCRRLCP